MFLFENLGLGRRRYVFIENPDPGQRRYVYFFLRMAGRNGDLFFWGDMILLAGWPATYCTHRAAGSARER